MNWRWMCLVIVVLSVTLFPWLLSKVPRELSNGAACAWAIFVTVYIMGSALAFFWFAGR